jgi:hypothetical protein
MFSFDLFASMIYVSLRVFSHRFLSPFAGVMLPLFLDIIHCINARARREHSTPRV